MRWMKHGGSKLITAGLTSSQIKLKLQPGADPRPAGLSVPLGLEELEAQAWQAGTGRVTVHWQAPSYLSA
jgi:hypothetical protein